MFWSPLDENDKDAFNNLPIVGDYVRPVGYSDVFYVARRKRKTDDGSVYVDLSTLVDKGTIVHSEIRVEALEFYPRIGDTVVTSLGRYIKWIEQESTKIAEEARQALMTQDPGLTGLQLHSSAVLKKVEKMPATARMKLRLLAIGEFEDKWNGQRQSNIAKYKATRYQVDSKFIVLRIKDGMAYIKTVEDQDVPPLPACALVVLSKKDGRKG